MIDRSIKILPAHQLAPHYQRPARPLLAIRPPLGLEPDRVLRIHPVDVFNEGAWWALCRRRRIGGFEGGEGEAVDLD